jgi:hypothetical protein
MRPRPKSQGKNTLVVGSVVGAPQHRPRHYGSVHEYARSRERVPQDERWPVRSSRCCCGAWWRATPCRPSCDPRPARDQLPKPEAAYLGRWAEVRSPPGTTSWTAVRPAAGCAGASSVDARSGARHLGFGVLVALLLAADLLRRTVGSARVRGFSDVVMPEPERESHPGVGERAGSGLDLRPWLKAHQAFIGADEHLGLPLEEIGELFAVWETTSNAAVTDHDSSGAAVGGAGVPDPGAEGRRGSSRVSPSAGSSPAQPAHEWPSPGAITTIIRWSRACLRPSPKIRRTVPSGEAVAAPGSDTLVSASVALGMSAACTA